MCGESDWVDVLAVGVLYSIKQALDIPRPRARVLVAAGIRMQGKPVAWDRNGNLGGCWQSLTRCQVFYQTTTPHFFLQHPGHTRLLTA
jgi:hypothetical protein